MVVCPGAELQGAVLLVEGKVFDLDLTGAFVDGWRKPVDGTIEENDDVGEDGHFVRTISTDKDKTKMNDLSYQLSEVISSSKKVRKVRKVRKTRKVRLKVKDLFRFFTFVFKAVIPGL